MPDVLAPLVGTVVVLGVAWLVLVAILSLHRPSRDRAVVLLRVLPDLARLCYRLARDGDTPRRYRVALISLAGYVAVPIDLIPDFLPGIGHLDEVILTALVLRWVGRGIGRQGIERHWSGSSEGMAVLLRLLGSTA